MSVVIIYILLAGLLILCVCGFAIAEVAMAVYGPIQSDNINEKL
jgi:hypothetical protein